MIDSTFWFIILIITLVYELNQSGPNCETRLVVPTVNACKTASTQLKITYETTKNNTNRPAGCYKDSKAGGLYFNKIIKPNQTNPTLYEDKTVGGMKQYTAICISDGNYLSITPLFF